MNITTEQPPFARRLLDSLPFTIWSVDLDGRITAANILIATGGHARRPNPTWITSDEAFHLPALPPRVALLGGGYIAVEFAHIFKGLGAKVSLLHRDTRVLRGFDPELRDAVLRLLETKTIPELADVTRRDSLKVQIQETLSKELPKGTLRKVFLPQFVIQ